MEFNYTLRKRQEEARDYIGSDDFDRLLAVLPTGYGKTDIAKMFADSIVNDGKRVIVMSPLKSLVAEQVETFGKIWGTMDITGDTSGVKYSYSTLKKNDVFVFTFEKLLSILLDPYSKKRDLFFGDGDDQLHVGGIVIDEIHNIGDPGRGGNLEMLTLLVLKYLYPRVKLCGLSATIGNPKRFARWLNAKLIYADESERPIPLKKEIREFEKMYNKEDEMMGKMKIVLEYVVKYPQSKFLIFCGSRLRTKEIAVKMGKMFDNRLAADMRSATSEIEKMKVLIRSGVGYHNAGLGVATKKHVEKQFKEDPRFRILTCTTTLAQGVNLPADVCVLFDSTRYDWLRSENYLIAQNEIHQMLGRAGRPNLSNFGLAVILSEPEHVEEIDEIINKPSVVSSRLLKRLKGYMLQAMSSCIDKEQDVFTFFGNSINPIDIDVSRKQFSWLVSKGFVERHGDIVKLTRAGSVTARSFVKPETTLHLMNINSGIGNIDFSNKEEYIKLFANILDQDEFLENIVVRRNTNDRNCVEFSKRYGKFPDDRIAKAFTMTFFDQMVRDGVAGENAVKKSDGDYMRLKEEASRYVRVLLRLYGNEDVPKMIYTNLLKMVDSGFLDLGILSLLGIPDIGKTRVVRLVGGGIMNAGDFARSSPNRIQSLISSPKRKVSLEKVIEMQEKCR